MKHILEDRLRGIGIGCIMYFLHLKHEGVFQDEKQSRSIEDVVLGEVQ